MAISITYYKKDQPEIEEILEDYDLKLQLKSSEDEDGLMKAIIGSKQDTNEFKVMDELRYIPNVYVHNYS